MPALRSGDLTFTTLVGPATTDDGAPVLCLHGFPDAPSTYGSLLASLGSAGFSAYAPTLRGYEPSSQPADGDYSLIALASDVVGCLDDLGAERAHLVGHDWGAVIGYTAAALHPDRFLSLTTMAVPLTARIPEAVRKVPSQLLKSWYMTFFQLRVLADAAVEARDWALVRRLWRSWSPGMELTADRWDGLRSTFEAPGVKAAMLAYYRENATPPLLLGLRKNDAMRLTSVEVPTLAITGADDGCIDTRMFDHAMQANDFPRGMRVERVDGAGHFVHLERPDVVEPMIVDWLNTNA